MGWQTPYDEAAYGWHFYFHLGYCALTVARFLGPIWESFVVISLQ